jgi:hypothetical protein
MKSPAEFDVGDALCGGGLYSDETVTLSSRSVDAVDEGRSPRDEDKTRIVRGPEN